MEVRFSVPEKYAYRVEPALPIEAESEISDAQIFEGEITFVSPEINTQTRKLLLKGEIENGAGKLKPGGFVRVTVVFDTRINPVVPARALVAGREGYSVYRIEEWMAHRQQVLVGQRDSGWVEILQGVHSGDLIVERGHESLTDNAPVKVINDIQGNEK
jgi:membrane fusion protein (multidrug efflux system)